MDKAYNEIVFHNDQSPDLDEINMNAISHGLSVVDDRVIQLKGDLTEVNNVIFEKITVKGSDNPYEDFRSSAGNGFYFNDKIYDVGYVKSVELKTTATTETTANIKIVNTNGKVLFTTLYEGVGNLTIPINAFIAEPFYIGINCNKQAFSESIANELKWMIIPSSNNQPVGGSYTISWSNHQYVFSHRVNYNSLYDYAVEAFENSRNTLTPKTATGYNLNDYLNGYYFKSTTEPLLVNAPMGATRGSCFVISFEILKDYQLQMCIFDSFAIYPERYATGLYIRVLNTATGIDTFKWMDASKGRLIRNNYVALGDSITWGHLTGNGVIVGTERAELPYPTVVANSLGLNLTYGAQTGCGWVQVSGTKTAKTIVDSINFADYDLVTLAFGTNDWNGNIPLGTIGNNDTTTVIGSMQYCLEKIMNDNQRIIPIVITPINAKSIGNRTRVGIGRYTTPNSQNYTLKQLCEAMVSVAEYYNIPCIDNTKGSFVNDLNVTSEDIFIDGLHPTKEGYIRLGQFYSGKIGAIFRPHNY